MRSIINNKGSLYHREKINVCGIDDYKLIEDAPWLQSHSIADTIIAITVGDGKLYHTHAMRLLDIPEGNFIDVITFKVGSEIFVAALRLDGSYYEGLISADSIEMEKWRRVGTNIKDIIYGFSNGSQARVRIIMDSTSTLDHKIRYSTSVLLKEDEHIIDKKHEVLITNRRVIDYINHRLIKDLPNKDTLGYGIYGSNRILELRDTEDLLELHLHTLLNCNSGTCGRKGPCGGHGVDPGGRIIQDPNDKVPKNRLDNSLLIELHQQCPWERLIRINHDLCLVNKAGLVVKLIEGGNLTGTRIPTYIFSSSRVKNSRTQI